MNTLFKTITSSQDCPANEREEKECMDFIFVHDLKVEMSIGILDHEKKKKQPILVNIELAVCANPDWSKDNIHDIISYADIVEKVQTIASEGHINLLESFAEKIASACLEDKRAQEICVHIEKTDIYDCASGVGCQIIRSQI